MTERHVMILAGEASGDAHAAEFVEALQKTRPDLKITGMGMGAMRAVFRFIDYRGNGTGRGAAPLG